MSISHMSTSLFVSASSCLTPHLIPSPLIQSFLPSVIPPRCVSLTLFSISFSILYSTLLLSSSHPVFAPEHLLLRSKNARNEENLQHALTFPNIVMMMMITCTEQANVKVNFEHLPMENGILLFFKLLIDIL